MWQNPTNREELDSGKILWNFEFKKDSLLAEKKCAFETESQGGQGGAQPPQY